MSRVDARGLKQFWVDETPSGTINGSNVTFTLSQTPAENAVVNVYLDGLLETAYSLSGVTITFTTPPALGQSVRAKYVQRTGE